jgi:type II secretory pathway pseudopilin PulG
MHRHRTRQGGFTYIGLLALIVVIGLMLTMVGHVWSTTAQRDRESELLYSGDAYRSAIASYFASGHRYPTALQDLVLDERYPEPKHHLRKLYPDPMTGRADWSLVMTPGGQGIMGVVSSSQAKPIKVDGFEAVDDAFKDSDCYCSWQFVYYANRYLRWGGQVNPVGAAAGGDASHSGSLSTFKPGSLNTMPSGGSAQSVSGLSGGGVLNSTSSGAAGNAQVNTSASGN